jgi:hypothetical protein
MKSLRKIIKAWWFPWLIAGLLLRLVLMPLTLHPDLWGHSLTAYFFAYEGRLDIYDFLAGLSQEHPLVRNFGVTDIFIYPPLTYFTLGIFRVLVKPFTDPAFIPQLMNNPAQVYSNPGLFQHLFLFKIPYLFVDIGLAFILANLFKQQKRKKLAFGLWMFNPLVLYTTFMIGQLDLLPTFFCVLAVYLAMKEKKDFSLVSLGIGGSYKMFPLLFIPPAAFVLGKNLKERIRLLILGFLPFFVFIAPYLNSKAFRAMVLFSPKSQKMLFMGWPVSGAEVVYPFIFFLVIIYLFAYYFKKKIPLSTYFLAILLLIYSVTHFHPQWFLWVTPFLIWEALKNNFKNALLSLILFLCWLAITLFFEPSLSFGLFNPIWPQLQRAQGLSETFARYTDVFQMKSLVRSVFAGTTAFFILRLFLLKVRDEG